MERVYCCPTYNYNFFLLWGGVGLLPGHIRHLNVEFGNEQRGDENLIIAATLQHHAHRQGRCRSKCTFEALPQSTIIEFLGSNASQPQKIDEILSCIVAPTDTRDGDAKNFNE